MPNWCDNSVTIEGPVDKIYDLAHAMERGQLLEFMVPLGEWDYGTAVEKWGTKWDISEPHCDHNVEDGFIDGYFQTAWGPPDQAFQTYLLENPDVQIHHVFLEEGNDFCGVNEDHRSDLPKSDSDEWDTDEVLKEVNDVFDLRQNLADWEEENDEDDA